MHYTRPRKFAPTWHVPELVFQGGVPRTPTGDIAGGGQVPRRQLYSTFQPVIVGYAPPTQSVTGPGDVVSNPPFLTRLYKWMAGNSSSGQ